MTMGQPSPPAVSPDGPLVQRVSRLVVARFPGFFADALSTFAIPVVVYALTRSASLSGLALTVQWLPRIVLMPIIGVFVDSFDARRQLVVVDLMRGALCLVLAGTVDVVALIVVACLLMLLDSHATIASESILATRVPAEAVPAAQSGLQIQTQVSRTAGPAAAGLLLAGVGPQAAFLITAMIFMLGGWATARVLAPRAGGSSAEPSTGQVGVPTPPPRRSWSAVRSGLALGARVCLGSAPLRELLAYALVMNFVGGTLLAVLPPLAIGHFHTSQSGLGIILAVASGGSIAASALVGVLLRRRPGLPVQAGFLLVLGTGAIGLCLASSIVVFGAAYGLWSAGISVFNVWLRTRRMALIPPEHMGRTLGIFVAAMLAAVPAGGLVLALFGSVASPQTILRVVTLCSAVLLLPLLLRARAGGARAARTSG